MEGIEPATADGTLTLLQFNSRAFACIRVHSRFSFVGKMTAHPATYFVLGTQPGATVMTHARIR